MWADRCSSGGNSRAACIISHARRPLSAKFALSHSSHSARVGALRGLPLPISACTELSICPRAQPPPGGQGREPGVDRLQQTHRRQLCEVVYVIAGRAGGDVQPAGAETHAAGVPATRRRSMDYAACVLKISRSRRRKSIIRSRMGHASRKQEYLLVGVPVIVTLDRGTRCHGTK